MMNQQQMSMAGMGAAGGPVGGMAPQINNATRRNQEAQEMTRMLNTYIYDYLLKSEHYDIARSVVKGNLPMNLNTNTKTSPGRRDVNGVDDMDADSKDGVGTKRPDDLPAPSLPSSEGPNSFLQDWWCQFWDIYHAHRNGKTTPAATAYLAHNIQQSKLQREQQQRVLQGYRESGALNNMQQYGRMMGMQQNGMNPDLRQQAIANRNPQQIAQMRRMQAQAQNMQRDGSGMDMAGQRPQSPGSADGAQSPSKRQRTEGNGFNGQPMGPAGRGQGMQGQQFPNGPNGQPMMLQNGINPGELPQGQMGSFQAGNPGQKQLEGMNMGVQQSSPMAQPNGENFDLRMPGGAPGQQQGNHALQDYQMQLMLLEQQNKKRLLMARQEQDNLTHGPPGQAPMGQPGFAPAMSPQGSRAGPSPNPNEQMKRGTPKMGPGGQIPGSPMPDTSMQQRGSPAPNFDPNMPQGMMPGMPPVMGPNGMMRPPSSNPAFNMNNVTQAQMQMFARENPGRAMPNGMIWNQGGPPQGMQQNPGQPPAPMGTPQQRNNMPPPPAPAGGEQQRTQPSSPAQPPAPPTPNQSNKAAPKGKKDAKDSRKPPKKAGATGATPASEAAEAPTPTPSTPITPANPGSFHKGPQPNGNPAGNNPPAVQPTQPVQTQAPSVPSLDNSVGAFGDGINADTNFNLDFAMDGQDVLENFDFDSFLHTEADGTGFSFDGMNLGLSGDGVEAGGDGV